MKSTLQKFAANRNGPKLIKREMPIPPRRPVAISEKIGIPLTVIREHFRAAGLVVPHG